MSNSPERSKTDLLNYTRDRTQHKYSSLTIHSFRGGIVTLSSQFIKFALQLGSVAILARILTPEDYGLFAIVIAVVVFGNFLNDMGLQMSTIQRELVSHEQVSNLFWVNTASGTTLAMVAVAAAPLLGRLYHEPRLTAMLAVLSLIFIANGLGNQQQAIMKRTMRFGTIALIEMVSMAAGVSVAIIAAFRGAGYWALVYMQATLSVVNVASIWFVSKWRPGLPDRSTDVRPLLRYGRHLMGLGILGFACRNMDTLLIGWYIGASEVGFYSKAYQLLLIPLLQVELPLAGFALSILSRARRKTEDYRNQYMRIVLPIASIGMGIIAFLFVEAEKAILVIIGPQWLSSVPIFRALAPAGFVDTFLLTLNWVLMSFGETARLFRLSLIITILTLTGFAVGLPWGAFGVAVAYSICRVSFTLPIILYVSRHSPLSPRDFFRILMKPAIASVAAAAGLASLSGFCAAGSTLLALVVHGLLFLFLYGLVWLIMPGGRGSLTEILRLLKTVLRGIRD